MKIRTTFDNPPIPDRSFDWSAVTEDYDMGHPIGHGSTEAEAIMDLKQQLPETFAVGPLEQYSEPISQTLPTEPRSPCSSCHTPAILSDIGFCCDCQRELTILKYLRENRPVYVLTESLGFYQVRSITRLSEFSFNVYTDELSSPLPFIQLSDFHLSIPSLVTAGITKANDAILRFNSLHKQHLALT